MNDPQYSPVPYGAPGAPVHGVPGLPGPPPPRKTLPAGVVVALVCGLVLVLAAGGAGVFFLVKRQFLLRAAKRADPSVPLTQKYTSGNGLVTAHYPSDFAAKKLEQASVMLSRNLGLGNDEAVVFTAIGQPITDDPQELARVLEGAFEKSIRAKGGTVTVGESRAAKCETSLTAYSGVETVGTYNIPPGPTVDLWSCVFVTGGHGYKLSYLVAHGRSAEERPLLRRILAATELAK
jgi:hypothetical protein